ncbi:hypothetical protein [Cellulomonas sp. RIT-PI-Y]|uniref:hypothetical protein n=1 Tax=Cellulomonas sp. RIT-PI-Y TaxID=3035297 RepID=UPI0021DB62C5|nr:hypothetical protein [Cellulomonas sp. RIT-PI-Y]
MVTDAILAPLLAVVQWVVDMLPTGEPLSLGPVDGLWTAVRQFDSLIPVMGPVVVMLGLLSAVVAFVVVRLILTVWNLIYP